MKFIKMAMGLFTLFLLSNVSVHASIVSDFGHAIEHAVSHPVDSATKLAKIAAKGFVAYSAVRLIVHNGCKCYEKMDGQIMETTLKDLRRPFGALLVCAGLGLLTCECVKSLMNDVKTLK